MADKLTFAMIEAATRLASLKSVPEDCEVYPFDVEAHVANHQAKCRFASIANLDRLIPEFVW